MDLVYATSRANLALHNLHVSCGNIQLTQACPTILCIYNIYVIELAKTDHLYQKTFFKILVMLCSAVLALHCHALDFSITHSIPKLCESEHEHTECCNLQKRVFDHFVR